MFAWPKVNSLLLNRSCTSVHCLSHKCWRSGWIIIVALRKFRQDSVMYFDDNKKIWFFFLHLQPKPSDDSPFLTPPSCNRLFKWWWHWWRMKWIGFSYIHIFISKLERLGISHDNYSELPVAIVGPQFHLLSFLSSRIQMYVLRISLDFSLLFQYSIQHIRVDSNIFFNFK